MYYTLSGCCARKLLMCRSLFCLFVILYGVHSLFRLLTSVVSSKARQKNLVVVIHKAVLSGALPFLRKKVNGFVATQLTNGVRHFTTHHTHLSMISSVLNTLEMLLQARQVSAYLRPIPARRLLQVASFNRVFPRCLNLLIVFLWSSRSPCLSVFPMSMTLLCRGSHLLVPRVIPCTRLVLQNSVRQIFPEPPEIHWLIQLPLTPRFTSATSRYMSYATTIAITLP